LPVYIEQEIAWQIKPEELKKQLAGKDKQQVEYLLLAQTGIFSSKVNFWPFWVKQVPKTESKIKIHIE